MHRYFLIIYPICCSNNIEQVFLNFSGFLAINTSGIGIFDEKKGHIFQWSTGHIKSYKVIYFGRSYKKSYKVIYFRTSAKKVIYFVINGKKMFPGFIDK